jgi:hypothetical protein
VFWHGQKEAIVMGKKILVVVLVLFGLFLLIYAINYAFSTGKEDAEKTNTKVNKALDENVKTPEDPNRPKDRAYGGDLKRRAYDKGKAAYETPGRQLDKFEKDSAEPPPGKGGDD